MQKVVARRYYLDIFKIFLALLAYLIASCKHLIVTSSYTML